MVDCSFTNYVIVGSNPVAVTSISYTGSRMIPARRFLSLRQLCTWYDKNTQLESTLHQNISFRVFILWIVVYWSKFQTLRDGRQNNLTLLINDIYWNIQFRLWIFIFCEKHELKSNIKYEQKLLDTTKKVSDRCP